MQREINSNSDLVDYLNELAERLKNEHDFRDALLRTTRFSSGSSSEFLHEAYVALNRIKLSSLAVLKSEDLVQIDSVLSQIQQAFDAIGGA